jgi:RHS repeat-associated protein
VLPNNVTTLDGLVSDDGLPTGTLNISWAELSGPAAITFSNPSAASTQATFPAKGVYLVQLSVEDGQYTSRSTTTITVVDQPAQNQPPTVNPGSNQTIFLPSRTALLNGVVADDGRPNNTLSIAWSQVSGPASVSFSSPNQAVTNVTFPQAGLYVLQLTANDSQITSYAQVAIRVAEQVGPPPSVSMSSLFDGMDVTKPVQVVGNVSSGAWTLAYALNTADPADRMFTTIASGTGTAINELLGSFDPTVLPNGIYTIRLTATDNAGQTTTSSVTVQAGGEMKVGNFTLSFSDLNVPLPGLPIQVIRTYDSRNRTPGDFGAGWRLGISNVRVQKSRSLGANWTALANWNGLFPQYCLTPASSRYVTATFPDGKVYKFEAATGPQCQMMSPIQVAHMAFNQVPTGQGTAGASLVPLNNIELLVYGSVPGPVTLGDYGANTYDTTKFLLTTAEGYVYTLDQRLGVTNVKDPNGNTLTINNNGITSSTGKNVAFVRDGENRIKQIQDPAGNYLNYTYDAKSDLVAFQDFESNTVTFVYDDFHYLKEIKDPRGVQAIRNEYDDAGRLISSTDVEGKSVVYTHDIAGHIEQVKDRRGYTTTYSYDDTGNVLSKTDPLNHTTSFTYDTYGNKLSETNGLGKTTYYEYDDNGRCTKETDPLGHATRYTYSIRNQVVTVTDALGRVTTNTYFPATGNLTSTEDTLHNFTRYEYNMNGQLLWSKDALDHYTRYEYDAAGNVRTETDALGRVTTYTYAANGNKLTEKKTRTTASGQETITTTYEYDKLNRLVKTIFPDNTTARTVYNTIGKVGVSIDPLDRQTVYEYDDQGRLTKTTYPDQNYESTTYDEENHRLTSTDRAGHVTEYKYDEAGRLYKTIYPGMTLNETVYNEADQVVSSSDANGVVTGYGYDDAGRRTSVTDALSHVTTFGYDNVGNQVTMTDARQNTVQTDYDLLGRQVRTIYPDNTMSATEYDAVGRMKSKTDQAGKKTEYRYTDLGQLASVIDALQQQTSYGYDEVGNRTSQTDALNHTTYFVYDSMGRRISRTLPLGQTENYTYTTAGNLWTRTDFNRRTTVYDYDEMNRLKSKTPDPVFNASPVTFTYTATGRRQTMTDVSGTTVYDYDGRNRLTSKQTPQGTLGYTYDNDGNVLTINSSNTNGAAITYTYDGLNRLETVTDNRRLAQGASWARTTYHYDEAGNLADYVYPNAVQTCYHYDALNRLEWMDSQGSARLSMYSYTLGLAGNRLSVAELSGRVAAYAYDDLYRLTSETISGATGNKNGTIGYVYDPVGNRKTRTSTLPGITSTASDFDANDRLISDSYDDNGNTIGSDGILNGYDFENKLIAHGNVTIVYDGDGNRVVKTVGGVTTRYLVDTVNPTGYAQALDELTGTDVTRTYTYGLDLISQNQPVSGAWTLSYYGYDGHGSVRFLTNSAGAVTDTFDYDAFGNLINRTGSTPNNYLFAGEQFDADLGLYYNRARYLGVRTGRFWGMDTLEVLLGDPATLHRYLYAADNPVNCIDPSGNSDFSLVELSVSMGISGVLNAMPAMMAKQSFGTIATNFAIGALEGGAFYISGVGVIRLIKRFKSVVMTAELAWRIERALALISEASPEVSSGIAKYFTLTTKMGKVFVNWNGTKHLIEMLEAGGTTGQTRLALALLIEEVVSVLSKAMATFGVQYERMIIMDGWEIIFSAPRAGEVLPVVKHLRYLL